LNQLAHETQHSQPSECDWEEDFMVAFTGFLQEFNFYHFLDLADLVWLPAVFTVLFASS